MDEDLGLKLEQELDAIGGGFAGNIDNNNNTDNIDLNKIGTKVLMTYTAIGFVFGMAGGLVYGMKKTGKIGTSLLISLGSAIILGGVGGLVGNEINKSKQNKMSL